MDIENNIARILEYDSESPTLDFKQIQYSQIAKHELLKDINAFANHHSNDDKYIILGVKEKDGQADEFFDIGELIDQAQYQQLIEANIEPAITFEYNQYIHEGVKLGYFRLFNNQKRPYLFKKDVNDATKTVFKIGQGFVRTGTSSRLLKLSDFESIYQERFTAKDRKEDLIIRPLVRRRFLKNRTFYYLDISIENQSNQSIDMDVEMVVFNSAQSPLHLEREILYHIHREENSSMFSSPSIQPTFQDITGETTFEGLKVQRALLLPNGRGTLSILQNSVYDDVFKQKILLDAEANYTTLEADVHIRSDDFTGGMLLKRIIFQIMSM